MKPHETKNRDKTREKKEEGKQRAIKKPKKAERQ
jgi:hypothetical protein